MPPKKMKKEKDELEGVGFVRIDGKDTPIRSSNVVQLNPSLGPLPIGTGEGLKRKRGRPKKEVEGGNIGKDILGGLKKVGQVVASHPEIITDMAGEGTKSKPKKGSVEMAEKMAKIRAMKKK